MRRSNDYSGCNDRLDRLVRPDRLLQLFHILLRKPNLFRHRTQLRGVVGVALAGQWSLAEVIAESRDLTSAGEPSEHRLGTVGLD